LPRNEEVLMGRASLLSPADRDLIEAVFVRYQGTRSVARLMGVTTRTVRRRAYRLARRLASRRFLAAARALPYLESDDAVLARMRFCAAVPCRVLCGRYDLSAHALRRRLDRVSAQIATISRLRNPDQALAGPGVQRARESLTRRVRSDGLREPAAVREVG